MTDYEAQISMEISMRWLESIGMTSSLSRFALFVRNGASGHYWMELDGRMDGGMHTDSLRSTREILKLVTEIDEFRGAWATIGRISPGRLTSLQRIATIESIGSSTGIEGAKLSVKQVEAFGPDIGKNMARDVEPGMRNVKTDAERRS